MAVAASPCCIRLAIRSVLSDSLTGEEAIVQWRPAFPKSRVRGDPSVSKTVTGAAAVTRLMRGTHCLSLHGTDWVPGPHALACMHVSSTRPRSQRWRQMGFPHPVECFVFVPHGPPAAPGPRFHAVVAFRSASYMMAGGGATRTSR